MTWLVTGGAGYIGAHVVRALRNSGLETVVFDDLSTGRAPVVPAGVPIVQASVLDTDRLIATMAEHRVEGVVHLAAKKGVFRHKCGSADGCDGRLALGGNGAGLRCLAC